MWLQTTICMWWRKKKIDTIHCRKYLENTPTSWIEHTRRWKPLTFEHVTELCKRTSPNSSVDLVDVGRWCFGSSALYTRESWFRWGIGHPWTKSKWLADWHPFLTCLDWASLSSTFATPFCNSDCRLGLLSCLTRSRTDPVTKPSFASAWQSRRLDDTPAVNDGWRNHVGGSSFLIPYKSSRAFVTPSHVTEVITGSHVWWSMIKYRSQSSRMVANHRYFPSLSSCERNPRR